jgi:NADH:ubiquinone oxidoreductase subunit 5 (subunit L)/multisubunit Na+/H+ antiporter MnhA subunit
LEFELFVQRIGVIVLLSPAILFAILGTAALISWQLPERVIGRLVQTSTLIALIAALAVLGFMLTHEDKPVVVQLGNWISIKDAHFNFAVKFVFDRLSVPFVILSLVLCGTVGAFANRYMHRESSFARFFVLYSMFVLGIVVATLAGTVETLFAGWELVGLSSALLVAFFHDRQSPVKNGLHVWVVYRVADAALLLAAVALHHVEGHGDFASFLGDTPWPAGRVNLTPAMTPARVLVVGLLVVWAAAGKSALVPFSGWLPRAMEGPTPSSAVFYGALSVHLGAYLLLRISPLLDASLTLALIVVAIGLISAVFANYTGKVQCDIKCALSFASLTQVGIIVAEIGLASVVIAVARLSAGTDAAKSDAAHSATVTWEGIGYGIRYWALLHILGHGCWRTLQLVRAPTILYDYRVLEDAIGSRLPEARTGSWAGRATNSGSLGWYRLAMERGFLDDALKRFFVEPLLTVLRFCDGFEKQATLMLSQPEEESTRQPRSTMLEDLV